MKRLILCLALIMGMMTPCAVSAKDDEIKSGIPDVRESSGTSETLKKYLKKAESDGIMCPVMPGSGSRCPAVRQMQDKGVV